MGGLKKRNTAFTVFFVGMTAALAGLLFGLDIGVISGVLPWLEKDWGVSAAQEEIIVSTLLIGACIGSVISGFFARALGRKKTILISALIFAVGSVLSALSTGPHMLDAIRFLLGIAVGIASYTAPLYLSEISPRQVRGAMISAYQLMITIGIVIAFLSDTLFSYFGNWRWMLGIIAIPATIMFCGVLFLPKSPRWLVLKGRHEEARKVLSMFNREIEQVEKELAEINNSLSGPVVSAKKLLANGNFRRVIILGMILQMFQQFTGINVVMYYAPKILKTAGFDQPTEQMWGTVIVGCTNVLATFIAIGLCDRLGRKKILYAGCVLMAAAMGLLGTIFHSGVTSSPALPYACVVMILLFIVGFAMSAGPLVWVICSEIYPLAGREIGITMSTATNWFCNAIIGATFLSMLQDFGPDKTFWIFLGTNILFLLTVWRFCPETKDVTLEEIEVNLMSGKPLRKIGI